MERVGDLKFKRDENTATAGCHQSSVIRASARYAEGLSLNRSECQILYLSDCVFCSMLPLYLNVFYQHD